MFIQRKLNLSIFIVLFLAVFLLTTTSLVRAEESSDNKPDRIGKLSKLFKRKQIFLHKATIKAIDGNNLTVVSKDKIYTVIVTGQTSLRRKFGSTAKLTEFAVGNILQVQGNKTAETTIEARLIRNLSIQKKNGTFVGTIESIDVANKKLVLVPVKRAKVTVSIEVGTKIMEREVVKSFADLIIGIKVSASGMWDSSNNTLIETSKVVIIPSKETTKARAGNATEVNNQANNEPLAGPVTISMTASGFVPAEVKIKQGATVNFVNKDSVAHEPASAPHPSHTVYPEFDAKKDINPGESWSFTFDKVGTWWYHDHNNASLFGKVIVVK